MTPKQRLCITFTLLAATIAFSAFAAPNKDAATLKKIDEAINVHYIAAQFDKAESVLIDAIKACGAKGCSGEVVAKVYIYVGVVRGNGKGNLPGARQAFENAQAADPNVTLDATLVTPAVLAEFNKVMGKEKAGDGAKPEEKPAAIEDDTEKPKSKAGGRPRVAPVGDLRCSPASGYEIRTAQPIPFNCEPMEGVVRGELYYKPVDAEDFSAILMKFDSATGTLRAQVPCDALAKPGTLNVYIVAQDENKELVDSFGNALSPAQFTIVEKTKQAAPTYPGERTPKRCTDVLAASETGVAAGQVCTSDEPCRRGLYCKSGVCRKTPSCESNADCDTNHCSSGLCEMHEEFATRETYNRLMLGVHFAFDTWLSPTAKNVCGGNNAASGDYSCYNAGKTRVDQGTALATTNNIPMADAANGGNIKSTLVPATIRVLLSADYALIPEVTVGTRLGIAFNGGPQSIHYDNGKPTPNKSFFPVHFELRGAYWFRPLTLPGFHPYIQLGFGMAEVDAKATVTAYYRDTANNNKLTPRKLDVWRKTGKEFVAPGFGVLFNFAKHHGVQLHVNAMYMLPSSGLVIEPSLGYVLGF